MSTVDSSDWKVDQLPRKGIIQPEYFLLKRYLLLAPDVHQVLHEIMAARQQVALDELEKIFNSVLLSKVHT